MSGFDSVGEDVLANILWRLDLVSLFSAASCCKRLRSAISCPRFLSEYCSHHKNVSVPCLCVYTTPDPSSTHLPAPLVAKACKFSLGSTRFLPLGTSFLPLLPPPTNIDGGRFQLSSAGDALQCRVRNIATHVLRDYVEIYRNSGEPWQLVTSAIAPQLLGFWNPAPTPCVLLYTAGAVHVAKLRADNSWQFKRLGTRLEHSLVLISSKMVMYCRSNGCVAAFDLKTMEIQDWEAADPAVPGGYKEVGSSILLQKQGMDQEELLMLCRSLRRDDGFAFDIFQLGDDIQQPPVDDLHLSLVRRRTWKPVLKRPQDVPGNNIPCFVAISSDWIVLKVQKELLNYNLRDGSFTFMEVPTGSTGSYFVADFATWLKRRTSLA